MTGLNNKLKEIDFIISRHMELDNYSNDKLTDSLEEEKHVILQDILFYESESQ